MVSESVIRWAAGHRMVSRVRLGERRVTSGVSRVLPGRSHGGVKESLTGWVLGEQCGRASGRLRAVARCQVTISIERPSA